MNSFPFSRTLGVGTHQLATTDLNVLVDTSEGAVNLILPIVSETMDFVLKQGYSSGAVGVFPMNITDISNNASVNNITITAGVNDKLASNIPSIVINENSGCDLSDLQFITLNKGYAMTIKSKKLSNHINIYNLHIHSKVFSLLRSLSWYQMVLNDINCGKKTLIDLNISRWRYIGRFVRMAIWFLKVNNITPKKGRA
jgi:hypothetical protein